MTLLASTIASTARALTDMSSSGFISDDELLIYINQSLQDLHNAIVKCNEQYFIKTGSLTPSTNIALPSDCYKIVGIDLMNGSDTYNAIRINFNERNRYKNVHTPINTYYYYVTGDSLVFTHTPPPVTLHYVPVVTLLTAISDPIIMPYSNFDDYITNLLCVKILAKSEQDYTLYFKLYQEAKADLVANIANRNESEPMTITDVYKSKNWEGF